MVSNDVSMAFMRESREYFSVKRPHKSVCEFHCLSPSSLSLFSAVSEADDCRSSIKVLIIISQTMHAVVERIPVMKPIPKQENSSTYDIEICNTEAQDDGTL